MRRTRLWLLLPLLLVLAQHGAWLHELSHIARAASAQSVSVDRASSLFENGTCPSCQSFGQLGTALGTSAASYAPSLSAHCPLSAAQYCAPMAPLPAPRNRGPPQLA